jgi:hypothetical protein
VTRPWTACLVAALGLASGATAAAQPTAAEIVARSVRAHGGEALTTWRTLKITGTVVMQDGIAYTGAYTLLAKAPDRLRVEHDATADRGRAFYEYFLNGGVAWSRRNLIPGTLEVDRIRRWLEQCYGIAFYATPGITLELADTEGHVFWPPSLTPGEPEPQRKVWLIVATVGAERRYLAIDQETARLLQVATPEGSRVYWDFKTFEGMLMPTRIIENTKTRQGETRTPYTWTDVKRNVPIEDWRFAEDMPKR